MFKKIIIIWTMLVCYSASANAEFFIPSVEASIDRGLVMEIMLKCQGRRTGEQSSSIMSFDKTSKQFCTAKNKCYSTARSAAIESCNSDEVILGKLK